MKPPPKKIYNGVTSWYYLYNATTSWYAAFFQRIFKVDRHGRTEIRSRFLSMILISCDKIPSFKAQCASKDSIDPALFKISCSTNTSISQFWSCTKESNSYMKSLWPIDQTECVSERFSCPGLPASLPP